MAKIFHELSMEEKEHMEKLFRLEQEKIENMQAMYKG